jgi:hypothetical protein
VRTVGVCTDGRGRGAPRRVLVRRAPLSRVCGRFGDRVDGVALIGHRLPVPVGNAGLMTSAAPGRLGTVPRRTGAMLPRHRGSRNPHGVRRHRPACGHARADFTSPCTCWSAGEYTWDIPLSAGWTWPRMGRAARCPPGGGSLSARPSSGTTLAPFNARGSLGLTPCCGRVPVDSVVAGAANYQGLAPHLCRLRCPDGLSGRGPWRNSATIAIVQHPLSRRMTRSATRCGEFIGSWSATPRLPGRTF